SAPRSGPPETTMRVGSPPVCESMTLMRRMRELRGVRGNDSPQILLDLAGYALPLHTPRKKQNPLGNASLDFALRFRGSSSTLNNPNRRKPQRCPMRRFIRNLFTKPVTAPITKSRKPARTQLALEGLEAREVLNAKLEGSILTITGTPGNVSDAFEI